MNQKDHDDFWFAVAGAVLIAGTIGKSSLESIQYEAIDRKEKQVCSIDLGNSHTYHNSFSQKPYFLEEK